MISAKLEAEREKRKQEGKWTRGIFQNEQGVNIGKRGGIPLAVLVRIGRFLRKPVQ
jgi:hypothetical protein